MDRGYSAHSMRTTFITTALENAASLEDVQRAGGHREPGTTDSTTGANTTRTSQQLFLPYTSKRGPHCQLWLQGYEKSVGLVQVNLEMN